MFRSLPVPNMAMVITNRTVATCHRARAPHGIS